MNEPTKSAIPTEIEGLVTRSSPFSVEETLERLQGAMRSHKLNVFAHIDHSGEARKVGLEMRETHVLIFGNPQGGTPLMVASPLLALDLPLKALIWQDEKAQVWVSYTSATYLAARYAIPANLVENIAGIDTLIKQTLQG